MQQGGEAWRSCPDVQGLQSFFPASSFSRENNPGWVWSRNKERRRGEVVPTLRDSKLCSLLLLSHERISLVESAHAAGEGRGGGSCPDAQGLQTLFPASSFSRKNNPGCVWSCSREGRRGEVVQTPRDSKLCSCFFFLSRE